MHLARRVSFLLVVALHGCTPFPGEPAPDAITLAVSAQAAYAGDVVHLMSPQFASLNAGDVLLRTTGADGANVVVAPDRTDDTTLAFRVPPLHTGRYRFTLTVAADSRDAQFHLAVAGQRATARRLPLWYFGHNAHPLPDARALIAGYSEVERGFRYMVLNLATGAVGTWAPDDTSVAHKSYAAGPSYQPGTVVLDYSRSPPNDAAAWRPDAGRGALHRLRSVACGWSAPNMLLDYTVTELSDTTCLALAGDDLWFNNAPLVPENNGFQRAELRLSAAARRVVLVSRGISLDGPWPAVSFDGGVAWSSTRYRLVPGAGFSPAGDTLFVVAQLAVDGSWVLDLLDAATGAMVSTIPFGPMRLLDVLVDPARPRLYVAQTALDDVWSRPVLHVFDRESMQPTATIPGLAARMNNQCEGTLIHGAASGLVHLITGCSFGTTHVAFDVP